MKTNTQQSNLELGLRQKRRAAVKAMHTRLLAIRAAEQNYLNNVPDNFRGAESFDVGENAVEVLDEVIALLSDAY